MSGITPVLDQAWHDQVKKLTEDFQSISNGNKEIDIHQKIEELGEVVKTAVAAKKIDATKIVVGAISGAQGQTVVDSVWKLVKLANDIDDSFARIAEVLQKVDAKKYTRNDGSVVQYVERWAALRKTYGQLITKSKDVASDGKVYTDRYVREVSPLLKDLKQVIEAPETQKETVDQKRKGAEQTLQLLKGISVGLTKDMETLRADATSLSAGFNGLRQDVTSLYENLTSDLTAILDDVGKEIKTAEKVVSDFQVKLQQLHESLDGASTAMYASVGVESAGTAGLLGCAVAAAAVPAILPPVLLGIVITSALAAIGGAIAGDIFENQVQDAEQKLREAQKRLDELRQESNDLLLSKSDVLEVKNSVDQMTICFKTITTIWTTIQSDARQLETWLHAALNSNPDSPLQLVVKDLGENIGTIYQVLGQFLQEYANQVATSGVGN
ncbi:hypothetical protein H1R20_g10490, partial [Candolleomyces eurysporus]